MKLTKEQFEALQPYEQHFETAVNARWSRFPGSSALDLMNSIRTKVTGMEKRLNKSCSTCILGLLREMGTIYFADKEEMTAKVEPVKIEDPAPAPAPVEKKRRRRKKDADAD